MLLLVLVVLVPPTLPTTTDLEWSSSNPSFLPTASSSALELRVNEGVEEGGWDQVDLRCPADPGEHHLVYRVSEAEFRACRVASPRPEVVMVCGGGSSSPPLRTITFRPYSPLPGGLEFPPSSSHYFISTSSPGHLHQRHAGACTQHNLRLAVHVAPAASPSSSTSSFPPSSSTSSPSPSPPSPSPLPPRLAPLGRRGGGRREGGRREGVTLYRDRRPLVPSSQYLYYYTPRDLLTLAARARALGTSREKMQALPLSSATSATSPTSASLLLLLLLPPLLARF